MVGQYPGASCIDALGDDCKASLEMSVFQRVVLEQLARTHPEAARGKTRTEQRDRQPWLAENLGCPCVEHGLDLGDGVAERDKRGEEGTNRGSADEIEIIREAKI